MAMKDAKQSPYPSLPWRAFKTYETYKHFRCVDVWTELIQEYLASYELPVSSRGHLDAKSHVMKARMLYFLYLLYHCDEFLQA